MCLENIKIILKQLLENFNRYIYIFLIFFININNFTTNIICTVKNKIIGNKYDNLIVSIDYLNHIDYIKEEIYLLSFYKKFLLLFNYNLIDYDIDEKINKKIFKIINSNNHGYLKIIYYDTEIENIILINLNNFKNRKYLFKQSKKNIRNIIQNFITNNVTYGDEKILYAELKYNNSKENITKIYKKLKNSFKEDNIRLYDLLLLLNSDICYTNELNKLNLNNFSLIVTDGNLEEKIYKSEDYINYSTFYEELANNELRK
jgi:hypothetical protein